MRRHSPILLSLALLLACGSAAAASEGPQLTPDGGAACPDTSTANSERSDLGDTDPSGVAPVRHTEKAKSVPTSRSSTRSAAPRWHSFLPGMIR